MICEAYQPAILTAVVMSAFNPRPAVCSWDWINEHGRTHKGEPFDGDRIPWCEGVCDAWDDPVTREVDLMWGTRTGKTTIATQLMASTAVLKPMPGLFATSTQKLAKKTVRRKIYPMLESIEATRSQLPAPRFRALEEIRLSSSPWGVAWSGSETQLADVEAYYGWGNEIDKWSMSERQEGEAGEGDPVDQFEERFKENPDHKKLFECSPSTKLRSRIYHKILASNNCRFWVPCPKCRQRQVLKLGADNPLAGGILFDRMPDGSIDPAVALATARYVCQHCRYEIHDDQRPRMMRSGKWAPEGCGVNINGRIVGTPKRDATIWGGTLSSLYSLQLRWGNIAAKFVTTFGKPASPRMFVNGWLADVWEPFKVKSEPEQVGERLATSTLPGTMPAWSTWLFAAVDCQEDRYVYWVEACGPHERTHLVEHGTADSLDWIEENVIKRKFPHEDGGEALWPALTLIDSGFRTKEVYSFCQRFRGTPHRVMPCKGANTDCSGEPYEVKIIGINEGQSVRTKKALLRSGRGLTRLRVNPYYYEPIIQDQLDNLDPGEPGSFSLNSVAATDIDLLRQLCNGAESSEPSKTDPNRHLWVKRWPNEANDMRDGKKYCRAAMDYRFKRNWKLAEKRQTGVRPAAARPMRPSESDAEQSGRRRARFRPQHRRARR